MTAPHLTETRGWFVFGVLLALLNLGFSAWILTTNPWPYALPNLFAAVIVATGLRRPTARDGQGDA